MNVLVRDASRARKLFLEGRHHEHTSSTGDLAICEKPPASQHEVVHVRTPSPLIGRRADISFAIIGAGEVAELGLRRRT